MVTKDRKDKYQRHKKIIKKKKQIQQDKKEQYSFIESHNDTYNNLNDSIKILYRTNWKHAETIYFSEYSKLIKNYVGKYVKYDNGYGVILGLTLETDDGSDEDLDCESFKCDNTDCKDKHHRKYKDYNSIDIGAHDKKTRLKFRVFDIFNPKIEYHPIYVVDINLFLCNELKTFKINKLIKNYYKDKEGDKSYLEKVCSICLDDLENNKTQLRCGHYFHFDCIKSWTKKNGTCPVCREQFRYSIEEMITDLKL